MTEKWEVRYVGSEIRVYSDANEFLISSPRLRVTGDRVKFIIEQWISDHNSLVDRIRELEGEKNG